MLKLTVMHAFVRLEAGEYRQRNMPTMASMKVGTTRGKRHPAIGKTVYVISESCFTKILGVGASGDVFFVVVERKTAVGDGKKRTGNVEGDEVEEGEDNRRQFMEKHGRDLLSVYVQISTESKKKLMRSRRDVWLTVDGGHFDGWEEVREKWKIYSATGKELETRYISKMTTANHDVFVTHPLYKKFGTFVGENGKGHALVKFGTEREVYKVQKNEVISM